MGRNIFLEGNEGDIPEKVRFENFLMLVIFEYFMLPFSRKTK